MSSTTELLNKLNVLRAAAGKSQLKSWKESRAKLEAAIASFEVAEVIHSEEPAVVSVLDQSMPEDVLNAADAFAKAVTQKKTPKQAVKALEDELKPKSVSQLIAEARPLRDVDKVTLADIARELNLNPKVLRAKMRRLNVPAEYILSKHTYKLAHKADIIAIIQRDHRRK